MGRGGEEVKGFQAEEKGNGEKNERNREDERILLRGVGLRREDGMRKRIGRVKEGI